MGFENMEGKMNVGAHLVCCCTVFIFLVTSVPISQYRGKGINDHEVRKISCLTAFGFKEDCDKNTYQIKATDLHCKELKQLFQAAEAFYIISVLVSCAECIFSGLFFMGSPTKILIYVLGFLNVVCSLIPWAAMTAIYRRDYCANQLNADFDSKFLRDNFKVSAGYGLTVTAWCLQVISMIVLFAVKS